MAWTGNTYIDAPLQLAQFLQTYPLERTQAPLASTQGPLTYFTDRVAYQTKLMQNLPAVVIDIDPMQPVRTVDEGNTREHGVPLVIDVIVPLTSYLDDTPADQVEARAQQADTDIKTLYGDLERLFVTQAGRAAVGKRVEVAAQSPGIVYDVVDFGQGSKLRARVAELRLTVWNKVTAR